MENRKRQKIANNPQTSKKFTHSQQFTVVFEFWGPDNWKKNWFCDSLKFNYRGHEAVYASDFEWTWLTPATSFGTYYSDSSIGESIKETIWFIINI